MTRGLPDITCGARTRSGGQCGRAAGHGTDHGGIGRCRLHGGSTTTHRRAAELELVKVETAKVAAQYGVGADVDVLTALQEVLTTSYAVARFWQGQVRQLESLTEFGPAGSTDVAAVVRAEERARRDLAKIATDAGRLGLEARRETLDQRDRQIVFEIIEGVVLRLGADPLDAAVHAQILAAVDDAIAAAEADVQAVER